MIKKGFVFPTAILLLTLLVLTMYDESRAKAKERRDEKIFVLAANSIAEGKYDQARILLKTLIYTYPDSPLVGQAKILIFYSDASGGGDPRREEARTISQKIEDYMVKNHPKPIDPN
jgi:outer membrane protein assembly factor BamD (BamD/ComL family)